MEYFADRPQPVDAGARLPVCRAEQRRKRWTRRHLSRGNDDDQRHYLLRIRAGETLRMALKFAVIAGRSPTRYSHLDTLELHHHSTGD